MFVYELMTSNVTSRSPSLISVGICVRKSMSSRIKLRTCLQNGFRIIYIDVVAQAMCR